MIISVGDTIASGKLSFTITSIRLFNELDGLALGRFDAAIDCRNERGRITVMALERLNRLVAEGWTLQQETK